jgi:hypothetical protein
MECDGEGSDLLGFGCFHLTFSVPFGFSLFNHDWNTHDDCSGELEVSYTLPQRDNDSQIKPCSTAQQSQARRTQF